MPHAENNNNKKKRKISLNFLAIGNIAQQAIKDSIKQKGKNRANGYKVHAKMFLD